LYTEQHLDNIHAQGNRYWKLTMIPGLVLVALIVYSMVIRNQSMTTIAVIVLGAMLIFVHGMIIKPLRCYENHLYNALHGRLHTMEATYVDTEPDISVVDGVRYYAMTFMSHDEYTGKEVERLMYFDALQPLPEFKKDAKVTLTYYDRQIAAYSIEE